MQPIEFTQQMKILAISYGKDFDSDTINVWYQYFKGVENETFKRAINKIIITNKFMPSIAEILEFCEKEKENIKLFVLDKMKEKGYFKTTREYEKALDFAKKDVIPKWLLKDMQEEYKILSSKQNKQLT